MVKPKAYVVSWLGFGCLWPEEIFCSSEMVIIYLENSYVTWQGVSVSVVTWFLLSPSEMLCNLLSILLVQGMD